MRSVLKFKYNPNWGISERLYLEQVARTPDPLLIRIADLLRSHYTTAGTFAAGRRVLDLACGSGYGSRMLRDAGAAHVIGCDLAEAPLEHARRHYGRDGITYIQGDAQTLTWHHQFDLICSFETIEHLPEPWQLLDRVDELLTPEGVFCLSVPLGETRHLDPFHLEIFSEVEIRAALDSRGFEIERSSCQQLRFRGPDLIRLGQLLPETRPTLADLLLTRRGWHMLGALAAGCGAISFAQYFLVARRKRATAGRLGAPQRRAA